MVDSESDLASAVSDSQSKSSVSAKYPLFDSPTNFCDVKLKVGGRIFHLHKAVLGITSKFFETLFSKTWERHEDESEDAIPIGDKNKSPEDFLEMLQVIYPGSRKPVTGTVVHRSEELSSNFIYFL